MKNYKVKAPFWRNGLLVEEGAVLPMSWVEAKYLVMAETVEETDEAATAAAVKVSVIGQPNEIRGRSSRRRMKIDGLDG